MTDIALDPIGSGYNLSKFNTNFQALEDKINDEILHLTGGNNLMEQNLDMNSNRILNLPKPESAGEPVINSQLLELASSDVGNATNIIYEDPEGGIHQVDDFLDTLEDDVRDLEDVKVENISDITDIASLSLTALSEGQKFHMTGWRPDSDLGGGNLYYDSSRPQTDHDGGTVFALGATPPTDFNDPAQIEAYLDAGSGLSGNGCLVRPDKGYIDVDDFGANPDWDGSTGFDNSAPINWAISIADEKGQWVYGSGDYAYSETIVITTDCDFSKAAFYELSPTTFAVQLSTGSAATPEDFVRDKEFKLPDLISSGNGSDWAGIGGGIQAVNLVECKVKIKTVKNYDIGLTRLGNNSPHAWTDYSVEAFIGCRVAERIETDTTGTGYVNSNNMFGGRYSLPSSYGTNVASARHIEIVANNSNIPNDNIWWGCSLEGSGPELAVYCEGLENRWHGCRWESINGVEFSGSDSRDNVIFGGYDAHRLIADDLISQTSGATRNNVLATRNAVSSGSDSNAVNKGVNTAGSTLSVWASYEAGEDPYAEPTRWVCGLSGVGLLTKDPEDSGAAGRLRSSALEVGSGNGTFDLRLRRNAPGAWGHKGTFGPETDSTESLGDASHRYASMFGDLPEYADDAAAGTGGLSAGAFYRTATGELRVKL